MLEIVVAADDDDDDVADDDVTDDGIDIGIVIVLIYFVRQIINK